MNISVHLKVVLVLVFLAACSMTPDYERPHADQSAWRGSLSANQSIDVDWWRLYGDAQLNRLVAQGLQNNHSLKASMARIDQARAALGIVGAALRPAISFNAQGAEHSVMVDSGDSRPYTLNRQGGFAARDWITGVTVSYELDLFGKNQARQAGGAALVDAARFESDAMKLVLAADIAKTYFAVIALEERKAIAEKRLLNAKAMLESLTADLAAGRDLAREIAAQRAVVAERKAAIASIALAEARAFNALAVLVGVAPQTFKIDAQSFADLSLPPMAVLQPAALLERRPDLMVAEARLKAANADIGAMKAALYPSINLGAGLAAAQPIIGSPSAIAAVIGAITAPIFEGGRVRSQVAMSEARKQELAELYLQQVLEAYRETENALAAVRWSGVKAQDQQESVRGHAQALQISNARFTNGTGSYRSVLQDSDALWRAKDEKLIIDLALISASIDLVKAMGGGWQVQSQEGK